MKNKTFIIFILFSILSSTLNGQELLKRYLETAAKNSPALKARFNEYQAELQKIPQVGTLPDPQVSFGYFIRPVETRVGPQHARISVSQMFPWFGTLNNKENQYIQKAKASYESFMDAKIRLFYEVKSAYFDLYLTRKAVEITQDNLEILNSFKQIAISKIESGTVGIIDGLYIDIRINDLENQLAKLRDKDHFQRVKFNKLLNVNSDEKVIIPDSLWTNDLIYSRQAVLDTLRNSNHQLRSLQFTAEALNIKEKVARDAGKPSFNLGLDYMVIGSSDNASLNSSISGRDALMFPMIGVRIPLYRDKYNAMIQEAIFLQNANDNKMEQKKNSLETAFEMAHKEYKDSKRRLSLFMKQKQLTRQALEILKAEYSTASKEFEELLRVEQKLLHYRLELEKARSDKQASIAFIYYLMGK